MKVQVISDGLGAKQYAVIFSTGDEAYSGVLEFAQKYHITSGHFTAIGALSSAVLIRKRKCIARIPSTNNSRWTP